MHSTNFILMIAILLYLGDSYTWYVGSHINLYWLFAFIVIISFRGGGFWDMFKLSKWKNTSI